MIDFNYCGLSWRDCTHGCSKEATIYGEFVASEIAFVEGKGVVWGFADQAASHFSWGTGGFFKYLWESFFFLNLIYYRITISGHWGMWPECFAY